MATLHVYLDESGNLNFGPKGSKYYVFSAAWTYDPAPLAHSLQSIRFRLLKQGFDIRGFHAAEDKQLHRDAVVQAMASNANWRFGAIVVEKSKVNPSIREEKRFYPKFASMMLRFVFRGCIDASTRQVLVFTDTIPIQKQRDSVVKAFKASCRADLPREMRFDIYHHPRETNKWLQVVDYCCWATYRKWEQRDPRTYDRLSHHLERSELDVLAAGSTHYYDLPVRERVIASDLRT